MGCCLTCLKQITGGNRHSYTSIHDRDDFEERLEYNDSSMGNSPKLLEKSSNNYGKSEVSITKFDNISNSSGSSSNYNSNSSKSSIGGANRSVELVSSSSIVGAAACASPAGAPAAATGDAETTPVDPYEQHVNKGTVVLQKFSKEEHYDRKFIWINRKNVTIHMSQHSAKDKSHKEASLRDVTSVVCGPPSKLAKAISRSNNVSSAELEVISSGSHGMSIKFKKGGGIDLVFQNKLIRDNWHACLVEILQNNNGSGDASVQHVG